MNVNALKDYARKMLELAIEKDEFDEYVVGLSYWSISLKDEYGKEEECVFAKMEAIYDFHLDNPSFLINEKFYSCLKKYTSIIKGSYNFLAMLRMIEYQVVSESENRAPFKIDNVTLLENLKKNLSENQALYKSQVYEQNKFWNTIEQHNESLSSNYGYRIL